MRIVIDLQGAQAENGKRGIGRYTLSLCKEMIRQRGSHEILVVLNGLFVESVESIRKALDGILPRECIHVWESIESVAAIDPANSGRRVSSELIREAFIARLNPDVVLLSSLFEGLVDDAVTSIGEFSIQFPVAVVLYDLIPLICSDRYLSNPEMNAWYMQKIDYLKRADLLLSISDSSREEALSELAMDNEKVVNISTACDDHFLPRKIMDADRIQLEKAYGIRGPFVMYTGGLDHRKNIEGLIRAYAALPSLIRKKHQMVIVCSAPPPEKERLHKLAAKKGLKGDGLIITGFVPEDDLVLLYNACSLFVFPSWHEGFGLPALEAMSCGQAVIGSNCTSVPEVIGLEEAMFDPLDEQSITKKMEQALVDDAFRKKLRKNSVDRASRFSWEKTAAQALDALEKKVKAWDADIVEQEPSRPRLAYVSPLPPLGSGIADYSAELLPQLHQYYDVEVIVDQEEVSDSWIKENCPIRDVQWFRSNAATFDRVIYHFGNSPFHAHMFGLLEEIPGVIVLHEFFLSHVILYLEHEGVTPNKFRKALASSHGWDAVKMSFEETEKAVWKYPCNLDVLRGALGVIVHSDYPRRLAQEWFGEHAADDWRVIPLLRNAVDAPDRWGARRRLGVKKNEFVVCCFGMLGPNKLSQKLLDAWLASPLARDSSCRLIFVGKNCENSYGQALAKTLRKNRFSGKVEISGWVDLSTYRDWLSASDVGVQLRGLSRGETSAAVLDCMNYGLATIVNANGSMVDLDSNEVLMLPDQFSNEQLVAALETLWKDDSLREKMGGLARQKVLRRHEPRFCATQYNDSLEDFYLKESIGLPSLVKSIASQELDAADDTLKDIAISLAENFPQLPRAKQLFVDISELVQSDARTGIQRVVRSVLMEWLLNPPDGYRVEPVYASVVHGYLYARRFALQFLGCPNEMVRDEPIEYASGDVFFGLDMQHFVQTEQAQFYQKMRTRGVVVKFLVYDLLPILMPDKFPDGAANMHTEWLRSIVRFDGVVCISKAVADEATEWVNKQLPEHAEQFNAAWFHLGADIDDSVPTSGMPSDADYVLKELNARKSFLMVGTLEPRKGQGQILRTFEHLWERGEDVNLVLVGKQGWIIKDWIEKLSEHQELNRRLFWLEGISDEYLGHVYKASDCLVSASFGEGFGLPLIEAAQHKKPIIARDILVFREVAGDYAFYFDAIEPNVIATKIQDWLKLHEEGAHPKSDDMPWLTWKKSARQLLDAVLGGNSAMRPSEVQRSEASPRDHLQGNDAKKRSDRTGAAKSGRKKKNRGVKRRERSANRLLGSSAKDRS